MLDTAQEYSDKILMENAFAKLKDQRQREVQAQVDNRTGPKEASPGTSATETMGPSVDSTGAQQHSMMAMEPKLTASKRSLTDDEEARVVKMSQHCGETYGDLLRIGLQLSPEPR